MGMEIDKLEFVGAFISTIQCLPLTREVDSPKAKTEGETEQHELPVSLSLSLAALDSSLVRGSLIYFESQTPPTNSNLTGNTMRGSNTIFYHFSWKGKYGRMVVI